MCVCNWVRQGFLLCHFHLISNICIIYPYMRYLYDRFVVVMCFFWFKLLSQNAARYNIQHHWNIRWNRNAFTCTPSTRPTNANKILSVWFECARHFEHTHTQWNGSRDTDRFLWISNQLKFTATRLCSQNE